LQIEDLCRIVQEKSEGESDMELGKENTNNNNKIHENKIVKNK
jgi:hypothetical protein